MNSNVTLNYLAFVRFAHQAALATVAAVSLALVDPVTAQAGEDYPTIKVNFSDLDLSRAAGAKTLYGRLRAATAAVCGGREAKEIQRISKTRLCREQAMARAVASINRPEFLAWYTRNVDKSPVGTEVAARR